MNNGLPQQSFDTVARLYDTYRPGYPVPLVEEVLLAAGIPEDGRILEIGSGTGKATLLFAERGYSILCIEPGKHLVAIARKKLAAFPRVKFRTTTFEDWEGDERLFDLVISAQAFHWVTPEIRYPKTAQALKPGGHLALLWNRAPADAPIYRELNQVYQRYAPELSSNRPDYEKEMQFWIDDINGSGYFDEPEVKRYLWSETYTTRQFLGLLNTYSDHILLPEERQQGLFAGIEEVLEHQGGKIEKPYEAIAYIARKRSTLDN